MQRLLTAGVTMVLLLAITASSQQKQIKISTSATEISLDIKLPLLLAKRKEFGNSTLVDYSTYTDPASPGQLKLPYQELLIAIPAYSKPKITYTALEKQTFQNSVPALNPKLTQAADSLAREMPVTLSEATFTTAPRLEVRNYFWYRDFYCMHVRIKLAEYDYLNNSIEEIKSYRLTVAVPNVQSHAPVRISNDFDRTVAAALANAEIAEQFRRVPPKPADDTTGAWIVYGIQYLKIGVAEDRIYRITKTELEQAGIATGSINPKTFQLFGRGKEQRIYVSGEADNSFDSSDFIEFYGHKNYNPVSPRVINPDSLPYNDYLNKYTDTSYYFLRWGQTDGIRAAVITSNTLGVTDSVTYYTSVLHGEKNTVYQQVSVDVVKNQNTEALDAKAWFSNFIYTSQASSAFAGDYRSAFTLSDIARGKQASLYARLISAGSNIANKAHTVAMGLKILPAVSSDTTMLKVEQRSFNRNERVVLQGVFSSDSLKNSTNIFILRNYVNGTSVNYLLYDWFELEYPRLLVAKNDSLYFEIKDSIARGQRIVSVKGLTSTLTAADYLLYQVKPEIRRVVNFTKTGALLTFADTIGTGSAYYLYPIKAIKKIPYFVKKQFLNLRNTQYKADYIGITHPVLYLKAKEYTGFIKRSYPVDTALVLVNDIYDEFAYGYPEPSSFKTFLHTAATTWQTPKPSYVCFIGIGCYDYKRYFYNEKGYEVNFNLVPSYGEPVSDPWFTMWDENNTALPQMYVGRIPAKTPGNLDSFLIKHQNHLAQRYDEWNKRALFFSGGDGNDSLQLQTLRTVNAIIAEQYAGQAPLALNFDHFYKTAKPVTDFGPFSPNYVRRAIEKGGLFVSYIGHSGTRTWDNSISDPNQLLNLAGKSPLVTDFGCSTNKFAEPDVDAFGALFVNKGQTIAYVGNTSLGFTSTSTTLPIYFYENLLKDGIRTFSRAHLQSKLEMFENIGSTGTFRIFALTNILMGDPLTAMALPVKPNLSIGTSGLSVLNPTITDQMDSVRLQCIYQNLGTVATDSFFIDLSVEHANDIVYSHRLVKMVPAYADTFFVSAPIRGLSGEHHVTVKLDVTNRLQEIYEDDNIQSFTYNVVSLSLRPVIPSSLAAYQLPKITILNPASAPENASPEIVVQYDTTISFTSPKIFVVPLDTFFTSAQFPALTNNTRYFYRTRLNSADIQWSAISSFVKMDADHSFYLGDKYSFELQQRNGLAYDGGIKLSKDTLYFSIKSGGGGFSKYGAILKNTNNLLDNTFGWGMGVAVIDPITYKVDTAKVMNFGFVASLADSLAAIINNTPAGKIVCMNVIDDGWINLNANLKAAIKTIGSKEIDLLGGREPWVIFGRKGAAIGTVPEIRKSSTYQDILTFDTTIVTNITFGQLLTEKIAAASKWTEIVKTDTVPADGFLRVRPVGITAGETADTLSALIFTAGKADLAVLNAGNYKKAQFLVDFGLSSSGKSPLLKSLGVSYEGLAELGVNYQTATASSDTVFIGQPASLKISVRNAGVKQADSVKILTEVVYPDNSKETLDSRKITSIAPTGKADFTLSYNASVGPKNRSFRVSIDPDNSVKEYYRDNNIYAIPFIVSADTALHPSLQLFADSAEFVDGDYVKSKPEFRIELSDPSLDPISDTTFMTLWLDDIRVYYNDANITYQLQAGNPKLTVRFSPQLSKGLHDLWVTALSASRTDTLRATRTFSVSDEFVAAAVFPYPNPFSDKTYFTFQLSQLPDEGSMKIFTISGRLIREIKISSEELRPGFNRAISWDGRDQDGDEAANGVYLCRIVFTKGDKRSVSTQKVVIAR